MLLFQPNMQLILWSGEERDTQSCREHWGVNVRRFILSHSACLIHIYVHLSRHKTVTAQLMAMLASTNVLTAVDRRNSPLRMTASYCFV